MGRHRRDKKVHSKKATEVSQVEERERIKQNILKVFRARLSSPNQGGALLVGEDKTSEVKPDSQNSETRTQTIGHTKSTRHTEAASKENTASRTKTAPNKYSEKISPIKSRDGSQASDTSSSSSMSGHGTKSKKKTTTLLKRKVSKRKQKSSKTQVEKDNALTKHMKIARGVSYSHHRDDVCDVAAEPMPHSRITQRIGLINAGKKSAAASKVFAPQLLSRQTDGDIKKLVQEVDAEFQTVNVDAAERLVLSKSSCSSSRTSQTPASTDMKSIPISAPNTFESLKNDYSVQNQTDRFPSQLDLRETVLELMTSLKFVTKQMYRGRDYLRETQDELLDILKENASRPVTPTRLPVFNKITRSGSIQRYLVQNFSQNVEEDALCSQAVCNKRNYRGSINMAIQSQQRKRQPPTTAGYSFEPHAAAEPKMNFSEGNVFHSLNTEGKENRMFHRGPGSIVQMFTGSGDVGKSRGHEYRPNTAGISSNTRYARDLSSSNYQCEKKTEEHGKILNEITLYMNNYNANIAGKRNLTASLAKKPASVDRHANSDRHTNSDRYANPGHSSSDRYVNPGHTSSDRYMNPGHSSSDRYVNPGHTNSDRYANLGHTSSDRYANHGHSNSDRYANPGHTNNDRYVNPGHSNSDRYANPGHTSSDRYANPGHTSSDRYVNPGHSNSDRYANPEHCKAGRKSISDIINNDEFFSTADNSQDENLCMMVSPKASVHATLGTRIHETMGRADHESIGSSGHQPRTTAAPSTAFSPLLTVDALLHRTGAMTTEGRLEEMEVDKNSGEAVGLLQQNDILEGIHATDITAGSGNIGSNNQASVSHTGDNQIRHYMPSFHGNYYTDHMATGDLAWHQKQSTSKVEAMDILDVVDHDSQQLDCRGDGSSNTHKMHTASPTLPDTDMLWRPPEPLSSIHSLLPPPLKSPTSPKLYRYPRKMY